MKKAKTKWGDIWRAVAVANAASPTDPFAYPHRLGHNTPDTLDCNGTDACRAYYLLHQVSTLGQREPWNEAVGATI